MLAAFLTMFVAVGDAKADDPGAANKILSQITGDGGCDNWARITTESATCMSSGWRHQIIPPYYETWAQNHCSDYGDILAHVDVRNEGDTHIHADDSERAYGGDTTNEPRSIKCCIDESDLCWKDQVEPVESGDLAGMVRMVTVHSGSYSAGYEYVRTHEERYHVCASEHAPYPDSIYCQVDPEGDAHTVPSSLLVNPDTASMHDLRARPCGGEGEPRCTCGGHICDRFDCKWSFNQSPASRTCRDMTGSQGAGFRHSESAMWSCSLSHMICRVAEYYIGQGNMHRYEGTGGQALTASMSDIRKLNNCDGVLSTSPCPVTYSTCLSNYNASSANGTCRNETITTVDDNTGNWCNVEAECVDQQGNWETSDIKVLPGYADDLSNCNGLLDLEC